MDNDDSKAICPVCGNPVKIRLRFVFPDTTKIKEMNIYCPNQDCNYEDKWIRGIKDNFFEKQPESPKTVKKTFVIEYLKDTIFGEKYMRDSLNYRIMGDPFIEVYEIPTLPMKTCPNCGTEMEYWYANSNKPYCPACYNGTATVKDKKEQKRWKRYLEKYPEKPEINEMLEKMKDNISKGTGIPKETLFPEELEIVKSCENCGWYELHTCNNEHGCDINYSEWKPIKKNKWKGID